MSTDAIGFTLALLTIGMTMVAARTNQTLIRLGASALWASLLAFIVTNTTAGLNWQQILVIACGAFVLAMVVMAALGRIGANRGVEWANGNGEEERNSGFRFPKLSIGESETKSHRPEGSSYQSTEEYRAIIHNKLHPIKRRR